MSAEYHHFSTLIWPLTLTFDLYRKLSIRVPSIIDLQRFVSLARKNVEKRQVFANTPNLLTRRLRLVRNIAKPDNRQHVHVLNFVKIGLKLFELSWKMWKVPFRPLWPWPMKKWEPVIWFKTSLPCWFHVDMLGTHWVIGSQACPQTSRQTDKKSFRRFVNMLGCINKVE